MVYIQLIQIIASLGAKLLVYDVKYWEKWSLHVFLWGGGH